MAELSLTVRAVAAILRVVSPARAVAYLREQMTYEIQRAYMAAKTTGSDTKWRPTQSSGAQENVAAWQAVTNKARDLARNNPYIVGARRRFRSNLVGEGIWPRPKIRNNGARSRHELNRELNQDILDRWERWTPTASANGDSLYQLQRTAANHDFDDGGFLVQRLILRGKLRLKLMECDHLDTARDREYSPSQNRIVGGIEVDANNAPVAYWIRPMHPSETQTESVRVPAEDIIHVFDRSRASDVIGIGSYASVVQNFFRLNEYAYSTMDSARLQNHFSVFIETPYIDEYGNVSEVKSGTEVVPTTVERRAQYLEPAAIKYCLPGEKPHMVKPEAPGSQYGPFLTKELQAASVGAGVSYESISHDGSQTNFAGSRQLLIIERSYAKMVQARWEEQFHAKIYRWFIDHERQFGKPPLAMPGFDERAYDFLRVSFSRPIQEWVDPLKDVQARKEKILMGLSTLTDEAEDMGTDIEEINATLLYEQSLEGIATLRAADKPGEQQEEDPDQEAPDAQPAQ
jgi:lambda family phage portal protein